MSPSVSRLGGRPEGSLKTRTPPSPGPGPTTDGSNQGPLHLTPVRPETLPDSSGGGEWKQIQLHEPSVPRHPVEAGEEVLQQKH